MKVVLFLVLATVSAAYSMRPNLNNDARTQLPCSGKLIKAIRECDHEQVLSELISNQVVNQELQGSYPLHWAVLTMLKRVDSLENLEAELAQRAKVSYALLKCGADYTLPQQGSKQTIFHILALHLSQQPDTYAIVSGAFNRLLTSICEVWFCKAPSLDIGKENFVAHMSAMCKSKDSRFLTPVDIALQRGCDGFFNDDRFKVVYSKAYIEEHIDDVLTESK